MQLPDLKTLPANTLAFARSPRVRKIGWWILGAIAAIGVLGALVAPPVVRWQLEAQLTKILHRKVAVESIRINPYTLSVTVRGLRINERDGDTAALAVEELYADASSASVFRLAPVLSSIRVTRPQVAVVRLEAERYNWSDLIDEFINKPQDPNEPPARFALANIEILDGGIAFDDRAQRKQHAISAIQLGVPFISSLPVHQEIVIEPKFSASVNGTPFALDAKARPFRATRDSTLHINIRDLDLTRYLEYVPGGLPVKLNTAKLETDLEITFAQPKGQPPTAVLSGKLALLDVDVQEPSGAPLLKLPRLGVELGAVEPLMRRIDITRVTIESPEMRIHRRKGGGIFLLDIAAPKADARKSAAAPSAPTAPPLSFKIAEIALTAGKLDALDEQGTRPVRMKFDDVRLTLNELSSAPAANARFDAYLHAATDETLALAGTFGLQPLQAGGTLKLERAKLPALWPYVEPYVVLDATEGQLDASTAFSFDIAGGAPNVLLKDIEVALRSFTLLQRSDKQELLRIPALAVRGGTLDLRGQTVVVGELSTNGGRVNLRRDRAGMFNVQKLAAGNAENAAAATPAPAAAKPWVATLKKLAVDRYAATLEDEGAGAAATARIENLAITATNLSTVKGERGNVSAKLELNKTGTLALSGPVALVPPSARLKIDATSLGIVPAQPYFERFVNALVSSGDVSASGDAIFEQAADGAPRGSFKGNITLANFAAVTKSGNEDLLRWKSLYVGGIDAVLEPLKIAVDEVALSDFFSRLVLTPDGRLNLQDLIPGQNPPPATDNAASAAAPTDKKAATPPAPPADTATSPAPDLRIGKITLAGGNVNFSDFFIKPNYTANLTGVAGSVSAINRDTAGDLDLRAKIDNAAPVEIAGKINPLAKDLFLDIKAKAHDIELAPLTPYAAKYVGYGIEKGKLSMNVAYKIENRKLTAQNNVILNQLTFGAKMDSPTALKLPVLFAVSLLKDRNGMIDINLPISGSIDDPKFSVGAIIWQVVGNLLLKAVTAPFALIGSLFGGGEELAYLEFAPGSAALNAAAEGKLKTVTKALTERPALKLDVAGRIDAEADREGLRKTSIERKVKAQKLKDTVKGGAAAGALDNIVVESAEYPKYLARAYGEEKFPKPRNVVGLAKDLPVPEMEQLMMTNAQVTEEDLRQLANQRAQAVKDYLLETSKIPADRIFLLTPRLSAEGIKDKGKPTRVDFSLK